MSAFKESSDKIIQTAINLKKDETMLIFTDREHLKIFESLYERAKRVSQEVYLIVVDGDEKETEKGYRTANYYGKTVPLSLDDPENPVKPGDRLIDACKKVDVLVYGIKSDNSIVKGEVRNVWANLLSSNFDEAKENYPEHLKEEDAIRCVPMPGITEKMYATGVNVDYKEIDKICKKIAELLDEQENVRITTPAGTDITVNLKRGVYIEQFKGKSKLTIGSGNIREPKKVGNIPTGEPYWEPVIMDGIEGTIVVDALIARYKPDETGGIIEGPAKFKIEDGLIQEKTIEGMDKKGEEPAEWLKKFIKDDPYAPDRRSLYEVGIGSNPHAMVYDGTTILEAEKVMGTCHIGFGSRTHCDYLMYNPSIFVDGKLVLRGTSGFEIKGSWQVNVKGKWKSLMELI